MAVSATRMIDTIGQRLSALAGYAYWQDRPVLSYTTRSYAATHAQRAEFKHFDGIDQAPGGGLFDGARIKDVEPGAAGNADVAALARAGARFVAYTFLSNYGAMRRAIQATGHEANVDYFIAAWTANESKALSLLASDPKIVAVQWASPTLGGDIVVPGTHATVRQLNVDLSVGRLDFWLPRQPAPGPHAAKGIWKGAYSLDVEHGAWSNHGTPGENVELSSEPLTDYAVIGVGLNTGRHSIKGIDRTTGRSILGR